VIAANTAAVAIAYLTVPPKLAGRVPNPLHISFAIRETGYAMIFFAGQVLINNCDIVLVKHFFLAREAGLYAAVAMVAESFLPSRPQSSTACSRWWPEPRKKSGKT